MELQVRSTKSALSPQCVLHTVAVQYMLRCRYLQCSVHCAAHFAAVHIQIRTIVCPRVPQAGQTYERSAIERHLKNSILDPISRIELKSTHLTPVFAIRSKAQEYRENAYKKAIELASKPFP